MKRLCLSALAIALGATAAAPSILAQATAAATGKALAVGLAYENANPDYGPVRSSGLGIFANYDFSRYVGATAEINFQTSFSHVVFLEHTYMFGVRGEYRVKNIYMPYAKLLIGGATASPNGNFPLENAPASYPMYAYGGGLQIDLQHHLQIRAIDFEQQQWLEYHPNGLTPTVISFGAAYRFD